MIRVLTPEQRETCMQAVVAWGLYLPEQRTGYIDRGTKEKRRNLRFTPMTTHRGMIMKSSRYD